VGQVSDLPAQAGSLRHRSELLRITRTYAKKAGYPSLDEPRPLLRNSIENFG
jgi:hypothetical protein